MELGLNLFWLLLAAASFGFWRSRFRSQRRSRGSARAAITLACALAVLFPIISLSDDLHGEQAAVEDSSGRAIKKWAGAEASLGTGNSHNVPASLAPPFALCCSPHLFGQVIPLNVVLPATCRAGVFKGRAPPDPANSLS
jgi:hypothetical protein